MHMDWQLVGTGLLGLTQLLALSKAYHGLKADNAKLANDLAISMLTERTDRISGQQAIRADLLTMVADVEASVKDMGHRVAALESGQDEWTKTLRQRTHDLAAALQALVLKVDRLERPKAEV